MHGDVVLRGPVWLFATGLILCAVALALYVTWDSVRRRARRASGQAEERGQTGAPWFYAAIQVAFLASLAVAQLLGGISIVSAVPVALAPVALGFGVAYLLRVVFPTSPIPVVAGSHASDAPGPEPAATAEPAELAESSEPAE